MTRAGSLFGPISDRLVRVAAATLVVGGLTLGGAISASAQTGDAKVRVVHASPDAPPVDVYVDGAKAIEGLAFGKATDLVSLPAGPHKVAVTPAGSPESDAVINADVTLDPNQAYEVAAVGNVAEIKPAIYPIDQSPIADGNARVRVIHASPDAPAVDVGVKDGPTLVSNLAFPDASDFAEVPAGTYDLEVRPAGTQDVALDLPGTTLEPGKIYDVFAVGKVGDKTLTALPLVAEPHATGVMEAPATTETGVGGGTTPAAMPTAGVGPMEDASLSMMLGVAAVVAAGVAFGLRRFLPTTR